MQFLFVGERRSNRAISMGVTWYDGRLAGRTLHDALTIIGIDPKQQSYINIFPDKGDLIPRRYALRNIKSSICQGYTIVGLGKKVQRVLDHHGVGHLKMIHPAARGKIRRKDLYQAHVSEVVRAYGYNTI